MNALSTTSTVDWRKVKLAVFARHCHPLSAWGRRASTPLVSWELVTRYHDRGGRT